MSQNYDFAEINNRYVCCACLSIGDNVYRMSNQELIVYKHLLDKMPHNIQDRYICVYCGYLLHKISKFAEQCQKADSVLSSFRQEDTKSIFPLEPKPLHNLITTKVVTYHFEPNKDDESNDGFDIYDDDDIPLVMFRSESASDGERTKKRKRKKSKKEESKDVVSKDVKVESSSGDTQTDCKGQGVGKVKSKRQKNVREGFTSRMVQETEEYVVIKLTKEQVLQEMQQRASSIEYQRTLYKCEKCVKGFNFEEVLRTHMQKHSMENGTLQCDICTQYCPTAVSLRGHIKSHTTRYSCKVCGLQRGSRQHLLEHHAISHTASPVKYSCQRCQFTTNKRTVMQRHGRSHSLSDRHACHRCGELFKNIETLRVHTVRHDKSKRLQCEQCTRSFIYPSMLHKHVQAVHERVDYYCVECDVRFKSQDNLRLHFKKAKRHRDASSYKYPCPHCPQRFVTPSSLSGHLSSAHGEPKQHSCDICRRQYSTREALRAHTRTAHSENRSEQTCHVCKRNFTRKSVLCAHVRTHTGERPYACACGAAFAQRATLRAHAHKRHAQKEDNILLNAVGQDIPNEA